MSLPGYRQQNEDIPDDAQRNGGPCVRLPPRAHATTPCKQRLVQATAQIYLYPSPPFSSTPVKVDRHFHER